MGLFSLHSPPAMIRLPSSSKGKAATERPTFFYGQSLTFASGSNSGHDARNLGCLNFRLLASGSAQSASGSSPKTAEPVKQDSKDNDLVFVAGATGRVGSRTIRELLRLGFRVRAGVRSTQRAETLVQSVQQMNFDGVVGSSGTQPVARLEIVECDLENQTDIGPAIGSASVVICCIGASEKEVFDVTGPYRIDYRATKNLIESATVAKVDHFILLTSLGTNKIGFPAAILNLFWGVLIWKRKAEEALIASGLPYTIVRPGGMERPTDAYKETHNIVLANEDTYFGGQVSNLQVAELMAFMAKNRRLSVYRVVEVIAETTVPLTPMEELLSKIPPQREIPAEPKPDPVPLSIKSELTRPAAEEEPSQMELPKERRLSPYTVYADLKPPTSPTPTPSTTPAYPKEKLPSESKTSDGRAETSRIHINEQKISPIPPQNSSHQSPYHVYDDFKPTTPSPDAPVTTSGDEQQIKLQKQRPLSPFTMYEDLKPPTSPMPSVPKY